MPGWIRCKIILMRKFIFALLGLASLLVFSGCYEIEEDVTITPSGSGVYTVNMDLSKLLQLAKEMGSTQGADTSALNNERMDTTISFKGAMDTVSSLSPEVRKVVDRMTMHIILKADSSLFKAVITAPFNNISELETLQNQMGGKTGGLGSLLQMLGKKDNSDSSPAPQMGGADLAGQILKTHWSDGHIVRTVNKPLFDSLMNDPNMTQVLAMGSVLGAGKYNTVIHLPRPVNNVQSSASHISDDKKTITFEHTLTELFDKPENFAFTIDY